MKTSRRAWWAGLICAAGVVGLGWKFISASRSKTRRTGSATESSVARPPRNHADVRQRTTNRCAQARSPRFREGDWHGEESTGESRRDLSAGVSPAERAALDAAWRAGDYARAAALARALTDRADRRQILLPLISEWTKTAPAAAAGFAQALPPGAERRTLLEAVVRQWAARDVVAASAWLSALAPEPDNDAAVVALATSEPLMTARPEVALKWAESVGAPPARWEAICAIAEAWARRDEAAARRHVEGCAALTREERARMLAHLGQMLAVLE